MGRSPRFTPDPGRAHAHEAGASVLLLQPSVHDRIGAVGILGPFMIQGRWAEHYEEAMSSFSEFEAIEASLVAQPLDGDGSGMRSIDDATFISDVYRAGSRAVLSAILALQHLTAEIEIVTKAAARRRARTRHNERTTGYLPTSPAMSPLSPPTRCPWEASGVGRHRRSDLVYTVLYHLNLSVLLS